MRTPTLRLIDLIRRPLYRNALYLWGFSLLSAGGGFIFWTLASRFYTPEAVGVGSATVAALSLLGTITHLGLGTGLVRSLPHLRDRRAALINTGLTLAAIAAVAGTAIFLLGARIWSPGLVYLNHNPWFAVSFAIFVVASGAGTILTFTFVALRDTKHVATMGLVLQAARLLFCLPLMAVGGYGLAAANGLAGITSVAAALWLLPRIERGYRPRPALSRDAAARLVPYGLANQAADLAMALPSLVLPIMVINTLGPTNSAHFYIGFFAGALLLTGTQALATSLFAEGSASIAELGRSTRHALGWSLAVAGLGAVVLVVIAGPLLLIFGSGYSAASAGLVRVVALAAIPASVVYITMSVLRVRRRLHQLVGLTWAVSLTTLVSAQVLMLHLGILGAGVGVVAGQSVGALLCAGGLLWVRLRPAPVETEALYEPAPVAARALDRE